MVMWYNTMHMLWDLMPSHVTYTRVARMRNKTVSVPHTNWWCGHMYYATHTELKTKNNHWTPNGWASWG